MPGSRDSIAGAIDDARIYDQALTVDQIKALKVKQASDIKPYAWWNFESDNVKDRTPFPSKIDCGCRNSKK